MIVVTCEIPGKTRSTKIECPSCHVKYLITIFDTGKMIIELLDDNYDNGVIKIN